MTEKERVKMAVRHEQPEIVPWHISFTIPMHQKMSDYYGDPFFEESIGNHFCKMQLVDCVGQEVAPDMFRDEFGVVWNRSVDKDCGVVADWLLKQPSITDLRLPDPVAPERFASFPATIASHADLFAVGEVGFSFFERAWSLRGLQQLLLDMIENPGFVDDLLDALTEFNVTLLREAVQYDLDAVFFGDDWAHQRGLMMGPKLWRRFLKRRLAQQFAVVKEAGKVVMIHCCGDALELLDDLIEIGVDVFNPFQPEVMDVCAVKKRYGDRLSFYGGIGLQSTLAHGTPREVETEARLMMREIGRGGGYILAPSHDVPGDVSVENMVALIEAMRSQ